MMQLKEHLSAEDITALSKLVKRCKKTDGNKIAFYPDLLASPRSKPSSILLYQKNQLIGFATAFFFDLDCAEITLLIHPAHRKQRLAQTCLHKLLTQIALYRPVTHLSFSVPHGCHEKALREQDFAYQNSEYEMKYVGAKPTALPQEPLEIRQATFEDMPILCELDQRCFPSTNTDSEQRFSTLLQRERHTIFLLTKNKKVIGKAHINWNLDVAFLSDIAILPEMQHQGFGTKIVSYCIYFAQQLPQKNIRLSVETHNKNALNLYLRLGFKIINAIDYWQCSFKKLVEQLKPRPNSDKI